MKRTILLVKSFMLLGLLVVGCDDDNELDCPNALTGELTETETTLTGTWALKSIVADAEIDLTDDNTDNPSMDIFKQSTDCQTDMFYTFTDERTYSLEQGMNTEDCNDLKSEGSWALNGDLLTVVSNCSSQKTQINIAEDENAFSYTSNLKLKDINNKIIQTKVVFTYERSAE